MGQMDAKVCIVTGAAGSIGFASTRAMLAQGASVLLVDMDEAALAARVAEASEFGDRVASITAVGSFRPQSSAPAYHSPNRSKGSLPCAIAISLTFRKFVLLQRLNADRPECASGPV